MAGHQAANRHHRHHSFRGWRGRGSDDQSAHEGVMGMECLTLAGQCPFLELIHLAGNQMDGRRVVERGVIQRRIVQGD